MKNALDSISRFEVDKEVAENVTILVISKLKEHKEGIENILR